MKSLEFIELSFTEMSKLISSWFPKRITYEVSWMSEKKFVTIPGLDEVKTLLSKHVEDVEQNISLRSRNESNLRDLRIDIAVRSTDNTQVVYSVGNSNDRVVLKEIYLQATPWSGEYSILEQILGGACRKIEVRPDMIKISSGRTCNTKDKIGELELDLAVKRESAKRKLDELLTVSLMKRYTHHFYWPYQVVCPGKFMKLGNLLTKLVMTSGQNPAIGTDQILRFVLARTGAIQTSRDIANRVSIIDIFEPYSQEEIEHILTVCQDMDKVVVMKDKVTRLKKILREEVNTCIDMFVSENPEFSSTEYRDNMYIYISEDIKNV